MSGFIKPFQGLKVHLSTLWYRLRRLGLTFKKTLATAEQAREDVRLQRDAWQKARPMLDPARLVCIDEIGLDTAMVCRYDWGACGQRVRGHSPQGHWHTSTFVAALRQRGLTAPMVIRGPMDGACFQAYVKEFLCPTLVPGDIVIWDSLSSHQVAGVREAIEAAGAVLKPLPPYSPDFNPIEQVFAKLKAWLRKAGERTVEALWDTLAKVLEQFTPTKCENYLRGAGYYALQTN